MYFTSEIEDSFLQSTESDTNYGNSGFIGPTDRYIMKFNLPAEVMGKHIISAELGLYLWGVSYDSQDHEMQLYRVTADWMEMEVTWNNAMTGLSWQTSGGDFAEMITAVDIQNIDHEYITPAPDIASVVQ